MCNPSLDELSPWQRCDFDAEFRRVTYSRDYESDREAVMFVSFIPGFPAQWFVSPPGVGFEEVFVANGCSATPREAMDAAESAYERWRLKQIVGDSGQVIVDRAADDEDDFRVLVQRVNRWLWLDFYALTDAYGPGVEEPLSLQHAGERAGVLYQMRDRLFTGAEQMWTHEWHNASAAIREALLLGGRREFVTAVEAFETFELP